MFACSPIKASKFRPNWAALEVFLLQTFKTTYLKLTFQTYLSNNVAFLKTTFAQFDTFFSTEMLLLLAILFVTAYFYYHLIHKRKGLPAGPTPLPVIGNLLEVLRDPPGEAVYSKWRKQFGSVYTYWMGDFPIVAVTDYNTIIDTFQKDAEAYSGRYAFVEFMKLTRGGHLGVIFTDGALWREQRRFALQILRDFGLGKNLMQQRVGDEVQTVFEKIDHGLSIGAKEHDLYGFVDIAIGSIINALLFGYRFHGEKEGEFSDLKQRVQSHVTVGGHPMVMMAIPYPNFFKHIPGFKSKIDVTISTGNYILKFFRERIAEHKNDFDESAESTDYVHAFLKEWRKRDRNGEDHFFSDEQLVSMCYDLWLAGQETTANTLAWGFAYLIHHPEVQAKCHTELTKIIGSDRMITLADKPELTYCNAVVNEIQRIANLVPQNVWHRTTKDVTINGHFIRKGTAILPQVSVVLADETIYDDPASFRPERFIDENGKLKRADELIPFSVGKRQCLGEGLARMELFLFAVNVLNRYKLLPGKEVPDLTRRFGGTVNIQRYSCRVEPRY
ncbi:Cytochrome P450-33C9 [Aphelenchoides bicaudatus]|nr:Cytochrome P450-33C9 [Aphelenchoides bicaudatus]